jgi:hypothetical protein
VFEVLGKCAYHLAWFSDESALGGDDGQQQVGLAPLFEHLAENWPDLTSFPPLRPRSNGRLNRALSFAQSRFLHPRSESLAPRNHRVEPGCSCQVIRWDDTTLPPPRR